MTWAWIETSSADTGSSSRISCGSTASARAIPIRWRWPPENSCGKAIQMLGMQADPVDQRAALGLDLILRHAADPQRRGQDLGHALARVERRLRILEDHLHLAPDRLQLAASGSGDVLSAEADRARGRVDQPHQRADQRRLAASGLADDAERLALVQCERDVVDGVDLPDLPIDRSART